MTPQEQHQALEELRDFKLDMPWEDIPKLSRPNISYEDLHQKSMEMRADAYRILKYLGAEMPLDAEISIDANDKLLIRDLIAIFTPVKAEAAND